MKDIYVAVSGNDEDPGTKEAPFASLFRARDAIRSMRKEGIFDAVDVHIGAGEYRMEDFVLTEQDSGSAECPVRYIGEGAVVLHGGLILKAEDFAAPTPQEKKRLQPEAAEHVVRVDLTTFGVCKEDWGIITAIGTYNTASKYDDGAVSPLGCELFVNDERMQIARYPNEGYLFTKEVVREGEGKEGGQFWEDEGREPFHYKMSVPEWRACRNPRGDVIKIDADTAKRSRGWAKDAPIWSFGYPQFDWADTSSIVRIDADKEEMESLYVSTFGLKRGARYYLYNILEELDAPGEWYLDREKGILYLYPPVELHEAQIMLSLAVDPIVKMEQTSFITFENISFCGTRGNALEISGDHITIKDSTIKNVGEYGAVIKGEHCLVTDCHIHHTGKGGVKIEGGGQKDIDPVLQSGDQMPFPSHRPCFLYLSASSRYERCGVCLLSQPYS